MKKEGLSKEDITELIENQQDPKFAERRFELYNENIKSQQLQIRYLEQVIDNPKSMMGNYDNTSLL